MAAEGSNYSRDLSERGLKEVEYNKNMELMERVAQRYLLRKAFRSVAHHPLHFTSHGTITASKVSASNHQAGTSDAEARPILIPSTPIAR